MSDAGGHRAYLVTGAASGIGAAVARRLLGAGHAVLGLDLTETELPRSGRGRAAIADVSDPEQLEAAVAEGVHRLGVPLDGLVAAAGIEGPQVPAERIAAADARRLLEVNLLGSLFAAQAVGRRLIERGAPGSMVLVGSILSKVALPGLAAYAASKGGVAQLTRGLAVDWGGHGIRVNAVAPGVVDTPMSAASLGDAERRAALHARAPLGRHADPSEIADVAAFLLSDQARFVTGAVVPVDGGWTAR